MDVNCVYLYATIPPLDERQARNWKHDMWVMWFCAYSYGYTMWTFVHDVGIGLVGYYHGSEEIISFSF